MGKIFSSLSKLQPRTVQCVLVRNISKTIVACKPYLPCRDAIFDIDNEQFGIGAGRNSLLRSGTDTARANT
jgi:hypothetical protein